MNRNNDLPDQKVNLFTNGLPSSEPLVIYLERKTRKMRVNERTFKTLSPTEYRLFMALRFIPKMDRLALLDTMHPNYKNATMDSLKVQVHNLRAKITAFGLDIKSNRGHTVSLIVPPSTYIVELTNAART